MKIKWVADGDVLVSQSVETPDYQVSYYQISPDDRRRRGNDYRLTFYQSRKFANDDDIWYLPLWSKGCDTVQEAQAFAQKTENYGRP